MESLCHRKAFSPCLEFLSGNPEDLFDIILQNVAFWILSTCGISLKTCQCTDPKKFSVELYSISGIPTTFCISLSSLGTQNSSGACFLLFLLWPLTNEHSSTFYCNWIPGWDYKFAQFALKQSRNPQSKQTKTKVCLFNDLILYSDSILAAAI